MRNYVQPGSILDFIVPAGGVVSGVPVKVGAFLAVPQVTVTAQEVTDAGAGERRFAGKVDGVFEFPKVSAQAWAEGDPVYYNTTNSQFTNVSATGLFFVGGATEVAANPTAVGRVRLNGVAILAAVA